MLISITKRLLKETEFRLLLRFVWYCGWKNMWAINAYKRRLKQGKNFPAFLFISVTNRCNLSCQGCWVVERKETHDLEIETLRKIIRESKEQGTRFFGILGGEPVIYHDLLTVFEEHSDCYFLMFTNGTMIDDQFAEKLNKIGNVTPLISIEGSEQVSDIRRGGRQVYTRTWNGLKACTQNKLITGVATSVCKSNFKDLVSEKFINELVDSGVHYLWYYIYRPAGPNPNLDLTLSEDEIYQLREFIVNQRLKKPIVLVDAYWDHEGRAMCPAAVGISHHVSPSGYIEPCPPIQFAKDKITDEESLFDLVNDSEFLSSFREHISQRTRGCILLNDPSALAEFVDSTSATDTSARGSARSELDKLCPKPCHNIAGKEIPEKSWFYRFAKKYWFFGFGAYG